MTQGRKALELLKDIEFKVIEEASDVIQGHSFAQIL